MNNWEKVISIQKNQEQPSSFDIEFLEDYSDNFEEIPTVVFTGTSLLIEALDGKKYRYYHIRRKNNSDVLYTPDLDSSSEEEDALLYEVYDLNDIKISNSVREYFQHFYRSRSSNDGSVFLNPLSVNGKANDFRLFFNNVAHNSFNQLDNLQDSDQRFISYINTEKERVPGQVMNVFPSGIVVKSLDGQNITIEGEQQLNTVWQDMAAKNVFWANQY